MEQNITEWFPKERGWVSVVENERQGGMDCEVWELVPSEIPARKRV